MNDREQQAIETAADACAELRTILAQPQPQPAEPAAGEEFCDGHCTWLDHQPGCPRYRAEGTEPAAVEVVAYAVEHPEAGYKAYKHHASWMTDGEWCCEPLITLASHNAVVERLRGVITRLESGIPRLQEQAFQMRTQLDQANALLVRANRLYQLAPASEDEDDLCEEIDAHLAASETK